MNWYLMLLSLFVLLITPISFELYSSFGTGAMPSGFLTPRVWNTGLTIHYTVGRDEKGALLITFKGKKDKTAPTPDPKKLTDGIHLALRTYKTANTARHIIRNMLTFKVLSSHIVVGLQDAAKTAELTGALYALQSSLPKPARKSIHITANFKGQSFVGFHCILSFRLGMLFLSALLSLGAFIKAKKELKEAEKWKKLQSAA